MIDVRVTECFRERNFIRIRFFLKQDEAKLLRVQSELNSGDLLRPVRGSRGIICAAPYLETNLYARVIVEKRSRRDGNLIKVQYMDYGSKEYAEKTTLRRIDRQLMVVPAIAYGAVVLNSAKGSVDRYRQALTMRDSETTSIQVLRFNKRRQFHEVYVHPPAAKKR